MKLIRIDLSNRKFNLFISKISKDKLYLAKIEDSWVTGTWCHSRRWCEDGAGWDFDYGLSRVQGSSREPRDELDKDFIEMYEIYDEDLIVKKTIDVLYDHTYGLENDKIYYNIS